jgi:hypothetical protein
MMRAVFGAVAVISLCAAGAARAAPENLGQVGQPASAVGQTVLLRGVEAGLRDATGFITPINLEAPDTMLGTDERGRLVLVWTACNPWGCAIASTRPGGSRRTRVLYRSGRRAILDSPALFRGTLAFARVEDSALKGVYVLRRKQSKPIRIARGAVTDVALSGRTVAWVRNRDIGEDVRSTIWALRLGSKPLAIASWQTDSCRCTPIDVYTSPRLDGGYVYWLHSYYVSQVGPSPEDEFEVLRTRLRDRFRRVEVYPLDGWPVLLGAVADSRLYWTSSYRNPDGYSVMTEAAPAFEPTSLRTPLKQQYTPIAARPVRGPS